MVPRKQLHGPDASTVRYRSTACRVGTHRECAESSPALAPIDVPLIYEACDCSCHSVPYLGSQGVEAVSDLGAEGSSASDIDDRKASAQT